MYLDAEVGAEVGRLRGVEFRHRGLGGEPLAGVRQRRGPERQEARGVEARRHLDQVELYGLEA